MRFDNTRKLDIIPLGRIAIDLNPVDYFKTLAQSETFKKYLGGSPANIAVGMARLGCKVGFIGKISDDRFGDFVEDFFKSEGIDVSHVSRAKNGESLGLTFTEILSRDESSILMYREGVADLMLSPEEVDEEYIASARMLLISGTALCASPSREAALKAIALAKKTHTPIVFDVDYRNYTWKSRDEITAYYALAAEKADIIMGSREEMDLTERFTGLDGSDAASAQYWLSRGTQVLVIKHGKQGSTAYTKEGNFSIKPFPVEALKSFGGGDGYGSAFLYCLLRGLHVQQALEMGSASASMLVSSHACSKDMPNEAAIRAFIKEEKEKYGEMIARA